MNPKTLKLLRNANPVVRIAATIKSLEIRHEFSKNRGNQVRTPEPVNTGKIMSKDVESQKLRNSSFTGTVSTGKDHTFNL